MNHAKLENELSMLYARVRQLWEQRKEEIFGGECGFSVLGSRPVLRPRLMLIGENPGFGEADIGKPPRVEERWPAASYLEGPTWPFKERLRSVFMNAGSIDVLEEAVVTNFLFFKSASHSRQSGYRWRSLPAQLRAELEQASSEEVNRLIQMIEPQQIMVLGLGAFDRYAQDKAEGLRAHDGKRWLVGTGRIGGVPSFGLTHPTGSRVSSADWRRIADWLEQRLKHADA